MSKYIKREDAIHKYAEMFADEAYWEYGVGDGKPDEEDLRIARIYYADLPTIDIVHCKDCKNVTYKTIPVRSQDVFYACRYSEIQHDGDFYCAYGESEAEECAST